MTSALEAWALLFPVVLSVAACSSDAAPSDTSRRGRDGGSENADDGDGPPPFAFTSTDFHTGYDGSHTFRLPVLVAGATGATLTVSDPALVSIAPAKRTYDAETESAPAYVPEAFLLTAKKAGTATLTASAGGKTVTASLTITAYDAARYATGEARYNTASSGSRRDACIACHQQDGGVDHSPTRLGVAADSKIAAAVTGGLRVSGVRIDKVNHSWQVSAEELAGLLVYLRALPPRNVGAR